MDRATVAEFHKSAGGRFDLLSVTVIEDHGEYLSRAIYDVERSRAYGYIYHKSGFGGSGPVPVDTIYCTTGNVIVEEKQCQLVDACDKPPWRSIKTRNIRTRNKTRLLRRLPKEFDPGAGRDILDWLHDNGIDGDAIFCSTCRDMFPEDFICDHIWWCDATGWWSMPTERCECKSREDCDG